MRWCMERGGSDGGGGGGDDAIMYATGFFGGVPVVATGQRWLPGTKKKTLNPLMAI